MLRRAGIAVTVPLLEKECRQLNAGFFMRVTRGRPLVTLKLAMTLDGRIATAGGDSRWVTSAQARELVHRMRSESDAILVGAGTVIADNPRLTSRIEGGHDPLRVIVDGRLRVSPSALVFRQRSAAGAILATSRRNAARAQRRYGSTRVEVIAVPEKTGPGKIGALSMAGLMTELGKRGINRVMIEGGALTAGSALQEGVVDRLAVFIAPKILGGGLPGVEGIATRQMRDAIGLSELAVRKIGDDLLVEAEVVSSMLSAVRARRRKDTP